MVVVLSTAELHVDWYTGEISYSQGGKKAFYQRYRSCQLDMCRATLALMVNSGAFVGETGVRVQSAGLHKLHVDAPGPPQADKLAFSGDQRHVNYRCWAKMRGGSEGPSSQS